MYNVKVNEGKYDQKIEGDLPKKWDMVEVRDGCFHILFNNKSYTAEVLETDFSAKSFKIQVNQDVFDIEVEDKFDQLIKKLGFANMGSSKVNQVKAPMPGLVVDILVKAGDTVEKGSSLLILGAMKMDNVIKSPGAGVIKKVCVDKGAPVDKSQMLIEFE